MAGESEEESLFRMYLPRKPGAFFKVVIVASMVLMLLIIYGNSDGKFCFCHELNKIISKKRIKNDFLSIKMLTRNVVL